MQGFVFNVRKPMFEDVRVRKAISLLLDFEWSNKQLGESPGQSPSPPGCA